MVGKEVLMPEPYCILTKEELLMVLHCVSVMVEIFEEKMAGFDSLSRQQFFEAKNKIHVVLERSMKEKVG
jgi:hypothetical protein